jgi:nucleoside-diphosphate-sugar epimerase
LIAAGNAWLGADTAGQSAPKEEGTRVFVTGATGFIGSAVVRELMDAGHKVLGLTRSDAGVKALTDAGAEVHRGDLLDLENLRRGAAGADAVIHLAFNHDFSKFVANCEDDRRVIEAFGAELAGTNKLLIVTSGTAMAKPGSGQLGTENDPPVSSKQIPRAASEEAAAVVADRGVRVSIVRLPQVHDTLKQGLVTYAIQIAREQGVSAYVGDRLALEKTDGRATYHAVAEEGVRNRDIAEVIGRGLNVPVVSMTPEQAAEHFGWLAHFVGLDLAASSAQTRKQLGWNPTGPSLITDLENMRYS